MTMNVKQLLLAKTGSSCNSYSSHTDGKVQLIGNSSSSRGTNEKSLLGEAELLLSFANIARCEISDHPSALDESYHSKNKSFRLPMLPNLKESNPSLANANNEIPDLVPRAEPILSQFKPLPAPSRLRTVSFDAHCVPLNDCRSRTPSPIHHPHLVSPSSSSSSRTPAVVSPGIRRPMVRSTRQSHRARRQAKACDMEGEESSTTSSADEEESAPMVLIPSKKLSGNGRFQPKPRCGTDITTIYRRKFSWKNYPELEQFLVANREEYLRHSALNYTLQQKQYNNRLTERLLEIASEHAYVFSPKDFNFVTVRDRIRCFYKSFVQSAKKRGILMGYAARKAGLISEDDLMVGDGEIIMPS